MVVSLLKHFPFLRLAMIVILIAHSVPGMFNNGINDFGNLYLNQIGFAPIGVYLAWIIKLSHIVNAVCLIFDKWVRWTGWITISILVTGIIMVHYPNGWFVVGAGRNGVEFNFLMIFVLLTIMYPRGFQISQVNQQNN